MGGNRGKALNQRCTNPRLQVVEANTFCTNVKVKVTLVQALRLCTGRTAHRGSRGIALPFHDHGTIRGEGSASRPGRSYTPGKDTVPILHETEWAARPVWTGVENLASTGIRSPDRPARSQSLYRLSYPAHHYIRWHIVFVSCRFAVLTSGACNFEVAPTFLANSFPPAVDIHKFNTTVKGPC